MSEDLIPNAADAQNAEIPTADELNATLDSEQATSRRKGAVPEEDSAEEDTGMSHSKFKELVLRGHTYREDYDFEMFGETVTIQLRPLPDHIYQRCLDVAREQVGSEAFARLLRLQREGKLDDLEDMDIEDADDATVSDLMDTQMGQMGAIRLAAKYGIDPASVGESEEVVHSLVDKMVGQRSFEIGMEVMALTSEVGLADDFPGSRGR